MWPRLILRQFVQIGSSKLLNTPKGCIWPVSQQCWLSSKVDSEQWVKLNFNAEQPYTLTEQQVFEITKGDQKKELQLKELLLRLYIRHERGTELPDAVKLESFEIMLKAGSNQLTRMLKYLLRNRRSDQKLLLQKQENKLKLEEVRKERLETVTESSWLDYSVAHNCLFLKIYQRSTAAAYNINALRGLQFGQKIIFDCSMESYMWEKELKNTGTQILLCYDFGRRQRRPFSLHLCNLDFNGRLVHYLRTQRPDFFDLPISLHEDSYLNLFDRRKLIFIDQRASKRYVYDPEDIYILRALVDRPRTAPGVDKKAAKEKIRYASLPIDKVIQWKPKAHKHLCLDQYHNILLDVKVSGNWSKAVEAHMPKSRYESIRSSTRNRQEE
ncbi:mitochondrial ribonuclease P protein 1 homolog [Thrips palmi]|uniref:Mitochondrial ribonuclease P protein 1 homolog n=1 Tax=Thrips palmi TaxID=161013 RepID=A0A6P8Z2W6_THRPL|nr:mitochondrial ribonuclease P protein 1 homolog [Thrips palmi]